MNETPPGILDSNPMFIPPSAGAVAIFTERARQVSKGYTAEHDSVHGPSELIDASLAYLSQAQADVAEFSLPGTPLEHWPWAASEFGFDDDVVTSLTKAGALIAAAIDAHLANPS